MNETQALLHSHPAAALALIVLVAALVVCILVGNALVCLAVCLVASLRSQPGTYLLVSLAVADFCVGALLIPLALVYLLYGEWVFGGVLCKLWTTADVTLCTASILNLCVISVDRYLIITDPLRYATSHRTAGRMICYICVVWLTALLISVVPLLAFPTDYANRQCVVSQNSFYQLYATMLSFYLPTLIIVVVNYKIYTAARRHTTQDRQCQMEMNIYQTDRLDEDGSTILINSDAVVKENGEAKSGMIRQTSRSLFRLIDSSLSRASYALSAVAQAKAARAQHNKSLKTLGIIMSCYIVCWMPFFVLALAKCVCYMPFVVDHCPLLTAGRRWPVADWLQTLVLWLGWLNSLLNPFIYAKFNNEFRTPFAEMLKCRFFTLNEVCRNRRFVSQYGGRSDVPKDAPLPPAMPAAPAVPVLANKHCALASAENSFCGDSSRT